MINYVVKIQVLKADYLTYGTGSIVSANGHILTASHLLMSGATIQVLYRYVWVDVEIKYIDYRLDIAILKLFNINTESNQICMTPLFFSTPIAIQCFEKDSVYSTRKVGKVLNLNKVDKFKFDSLVTDIIACNGCSGSPITNTKGDILVGVLTWSTETTSGGSVMRTWYDIVRSVINGQKISKLMINCKLTYFLNYCMVLESKVDNIPVGSKIISVNGNVVGLKYVSIESIVYSSKEKNALICFINSKTGLKETCHISLVEYKDCIFTNDKPISNMTLVNLI